MKKIIIAVGIIAALVASYVIGNQHGKLEAITEAEFFIVSYDDEVEFDGNVYDTSLFIELDGSVYEQGLYIG